MATGNLEKIRDLTFGEVFEIWREIEEGLEHWQSFWRAKGYGSWEEWRQKTHAALRGSELSWALYRVNDPLEEVPNWRGGMFHSWTKWFYEPFEEWSPRLRDLLAHPGVHNHWYIREIAHNFPLRTTLTAIRLANGDISIVEGMHRACALTVLAKKYPSSKREMHEAVLKTMIVHVALADWPFGELPRLGHWD